MTLLFSAILQQTKREWCKRKEILNSMLEECSKETSGSAMARLDQEANSQRDNEKKYDVDKLYAEYEEEMNKNRRRAVGPESFGLVDTDVNLRKYRIISGVYCTDFLETPQQDKRLNARSFIRTSK